MMKFSKRILCLLMALWLCAGFLFTLPVSAADPQVEYTYQGDVVYNWGYRGELCTFLSPMAEDFYAANSVTYAALAALSGSTTTSSVPNSEMYRVLQELMESNHDYKTSYDATKDYYDNTDCQGGGGKISSFYSGTAIGPAWGQGSWNREHTWPNSKGLAGQDENDIMMLRPTATTENSTRGNTAYGESESFYDPNSESGGKYNLHGDVARIWLYVYVRWGNTSYAWGSSGVMESRDVLLKWMEEDPVDTWEMGRNDSVQSITGTRNVFVDFPELGFLLFGESVPSDYESPSGEGSFSSYEITALSNNTAWGTVSQSGRNITATPAAGYYVQGASVISGTAKLTQNGNTFTVSASSDCTVLISFAPRTAARLTYYQNGTLAASHSCYQGDTVTLPAHTGTAPEGYTFLGWLTQPLEETDQKPLDILSPGDSFTVNAQDRSLYALYSRTEGDGNADPDAFVLHSGEVEPGSYLITFGGSAMIAQEVNSRLSYDAVTDVNGVVTAPHGSMVWQVERTADGYYTLFNAETELYAAGNSTKNNATLLTDITDFAKWSVSDSYEFVNLGQTNKGIHANLRKNGTYGFGCYSTGTGGSLTLYKGASGTIFYTTQTFVCEHTNQQQTPAQNPTCVDSGYTAGIWCSDCESYLSGHAEIPAAGHSYTAVDTAPTETEQGYTTHTCEVCGDSYRDSYVDALGHTYRVDFMTPANVTHPASMECQKAGIILPEAQAPQGYTFAGWVSAPVRATEEKPVFYAPGSTFTATADTRLYALYTYTEGTGPTGYVQKDITEIAPTDTVVITMRYEDTVYALPNDTGTGDCDAVTVTVLAGMLSQTPGNNLLWNVQGDASGYTFYVNGSTDSWLYCTNTNAGVKIGTNSNKAFTIDADSGYLHNTATGRYVGVYKTNPDWRCYTSIHNNIKDQALSFYVLGQGSTTWYTTLTETAPFGVYAHDVYQTTCASLEQAQSVCENATVLLLADAAVNDSLHSDLYVDLNGYALTGSLEQNGYAVYGMDSTTNAYTADCAGLFSCVDAQEKPVIPMRQAKAENGCRYLAIPEGEGYSFHRFYLGLTHITLKPCTTGVGYKAIFCGDDKVKAQIESFGYTLTLGDFTPVTVTKTGDGFVSGQTVTLRVDHCNIEAYGETDLCATVHMKLSDGTVMESTAQSITVRSLMERINTIASTLTAEQLSAVAAMIEANPIIKTWDTGDLYSE